MSRGTGVFMPKVVVDAAGEADPASSNARSRSGRRRRSSTSSAPSPSCSQALAQAGTPPTYAHYFSSTFDDDAWNSSTSWSSACLDAPGPAFPVPAWGPAAPDVLGRSDSPLLVQLVEPAALAVDVNGSASGPLPHCDSWPLAAAPGAAGASALAGISPAPSLLQLHDLAVPGLAPAAPALLSAQLPQPAVLLGAAGVQQAALTQPAAGGLGAFASLAEHFPGTGAIEHKLQQLAAMQAMQEQLQAELAVLVAGGFLP